MSRGQGHFDVTSCPDPEEDLGCLHLDTLDPEAVEVCVDEFLASDPLTNSLSPAATPRRCPPPPAMCDLYSEVELAPRRPPPSPRCEAPGLGTRVRTFSQQLWERVHPPPPAVEFPGTADQPWDQVILDDVDGVCEYNPRGQLQIDWDQVEADLAQEAGGDSGENRFDGSDYGRCQH